MVLDVLVLGVCLRTFFNEFVSLIMGNGAKNGGPSRIIISRLVQFCSCVYIVLLSFCLHFGERNVHVARIAVFSEGFRIFKQAFHILGGGFLFVGFRRELGEHIGAERSRSHFE